MFNPNELQGMRSFYESELENTLKRLHHIQSVLAKLSSDAPMAGVPAAAPKKRVRKPKAVTAAAGVAAPAVSAAPKKRGRKPGSTAKKKAAAKKSAGKPGRASVWGKYIVDHLKTINRPITYVELISDAMKHFNIPLAKETSLTNAITQSAFRLRTTNKQIDTHGIKGTRVKYIGLSEWFESEGKLNAEYAAKLPS
jgi:hypothetical protein